ncbi:MAG: efflux RND transporter periplasmic adaptor subunit [Opitutales bacterium]
MSQEDSTNEKANHSSRIGWRVGLAGLVVLLVLAWQADLFTPKTQPGEVAREPDDTSGMDFAEVEEIRLPRERKFTGSVVPRFEIESAPQIGGTVEAVLVKAGDRVREGDLLMRLDRAAPLARRDEAEAALREAEAARRGARRLLERITQAVEAETLPETSRIEAQQAAETAARAVERAEAALQGAQVQLDYTELRSTRDAVILDALLEAGDQARPGRPAVLAYDPAQMELVAHVPASMVGHFPEDAVVACRIPAADLSLDGTVRTRVPRADPRSRTVEVKIALDSPASLLPGMYGTVAVEGEPRRALMVPESAIERIRQLDTVWVLHDETRLDRRFVRTGQSSGSQIEILAGLRTGDRVALRSEETTGSGTPPDTP